MLIYYDLETTGLNQFHDRITEYCFIKENKNKDKITSLVNPQMKIPYNVTNITGINDSMVEQYPIFQDHSQQIMEFITMDSVNYLIAHNGDNYDYIMLKEHYKKIGTNLNNFTIKTIDTLLLAKKLFPNISRYNLKNLTKVFGLEEHGAHRAEGDTLMMRNLFIYLCNQLIEILGTDMDTIHKKPEIIYNYLYN